ncbi:hypothetical protein J1N35_005241 [Gossypium stocksii]|uniref:Retrovirus-related Pol polyprotein from transposon TNT 1-94-like beta-barrel domain-containing protein n=1 Tax=Gossypium stocksii TaxID=47602 RepID=A0A9D3WDF7_9ROSI|nr:hypothetical protein J1N35_005241 [Gossypium stocksii]
MIQNRKSLMKRLCLQSSCASRIQYCRRETLIYGRDKLSFEDVKGHLLSKDKFDNELHLDNKVDRQASILVASKKRDKMYHYRKKLGHVKANCYKLRNKRPVESNEEDVAVSTSDNSKLTSEWILDSGCSFHMCPNKEWFSIYSSVEGGVVRIGNDSSSKVIGIGTVKIRIHNGTIRTLSNVRYVPDLRKNLISLSNLDLKGCKINIESSGIKVSRGSLIFFKGKRTGSLYILEGSTVTGEIGHPSSVTESKSTRLERRQLGHRREKCTSRRLEVFQFLSTDSTQLIPCIIQDKLVAGFGKDGVVEI